MKRKDFLLIGVILAAAFIFWFVPYAGSRHADGQAMLRITVDGDEYGTYPLDKDRKIKIGDTNVCEIKNGEVKMTEADCPDHLCLKQSKISCSSIGTIVCLPNRVVLEIVNTENPDESHMPDAIVS